MQLGIVLRFTKNFYADKIIGLCTTAFSAVKFATILNIIQIAILSALFVRRYRKY